MYSPAWIVLLIFAFSLSRTSHLDLHRAETARALTAVEYYLDKVKGLKVDSLVKWHGDIDPTDQAPFRVPCFPGGEHSISPQQEKEFRWVFFSLTYWSSLKKPMLQDSTACHLKCISNKKSSLFIGCTAEAWTRVADNSDTQKFVKVSISSTFDEVHFD